MDFMGATAILVGALGYAGVMAWVVCKVYFYCKLRYHRTVADMTYRPAVGERS